jgi:hypothetical protein
MMDTSKIRYKNKLLSDYSKEELIEIIGEIIERIDETTGERHHENKILRNLRRKE